MAKPAITFKITNLQKVRLAFKLADENIHKELSKALFVEGSRIATRAKVILNEKGHVVTATLLRSISVQPVVEQGGVLEVNVGTNIVYAPKIEALPDGGYLLPAFIENAEKVQAGIQKAIDRAIGG